MPSNYRVIHYTAGGYGLHSLEYGEPPKAAKKGDGLPVEKWEADPGVLGCTEAEGVFGLKRRMKQMRDAFLRPVIEEADLAKAKKEKKT